MPHNRLQTKYYPLLSSVVRCGAGSGAAAPVARGVASAARPGRGGAREAVPGIALASRLKMKLSLHDTQLWRRRLAHSNHTATE